MTGYEFTFADAKLTALPSGALWWASRQLLCFSDLHLGKSERLARRGGMLLPPYDTSDTIARLSADISTCKSHIIVCLGDSFDDISASGVLEDEAAANLAGLVSAHDWIWIEGNHDKGSNALPGQQRQEFQLGGLRFRHIAQAGAPTGEVSGHFHPKIRVPTRARALSRPCFLVDGKKLILPAYGTYTGGLWADSPVLRELVEPDGLAILTGRQAVAVPLGCCV